MILNTRQSIFPVILIDFEKDGEFKVDKIRGGKFLGTGFFINNGKLSIFVTARHVVDFQLKKNQKIGIGDINENGKYWWDYFEFHTASDLAISVIEFGLPPFVSPLMIANPHEKLSIGTAVFSFGFPLSESLSESGKSILRINEIFFSGYISTIYDKSALDIVHRPFITNYALSFDCPNGLSGAPLLVAKNDNPYVAGMIYGNNKIQYLVDEVIEIEDEKQIYKEQNYKMTYFGLSSGLEELLNGEDFSKFNPYR